MIVKFFVCIVIALSALPGYAVGQEPMSGGSPSGQEQPQVGGGIAWYTDFAQASATAKSSNKPLLLFFTGSDWCGWCKKLDQEVFQSPEFIQAAGQEFVFVEVDFPTSKPLLSGQLQANTRLKQKYGVTGYPTVVLLDPNGNFIAETGYRPGGGRAYADYLKLLLKQ